MGKTDGTAYGSVDFNKDRRRRKRERDLAYKKGKATAKKGGRKARH